MVPGTRLRSLERSCGAWGDGQPSRSADGRVRPLHVKVSWFGITPRFLSFPFLDGLCNKRLGFPFEFAGLAGSSVTFLNSNITRRVLSITLDIGSIIRVDLIKTSLLQVLADSRTDAGSAHADCFLCCPSRPSRCFSIFLALDLPHLSPVRQRHVDRLAALQTKNTS